MDFPVDGEASSNSVSRKNDGLLDDKLKTLQRTPLDDDDDEDEDETLIDNGDTFDEDDKGDDEEELPVTLGFVEKPINEWSLLRHSFPSKAGGTTVWLDPLNLPSGKSCVCDLCGEPLQFLLQVCAPLRGKDSTFHRTLYVFMCPSMSCLLKDQHEQWKHHSQIASRRYFAANYHAPIHFTPQSPQNTMGVTSHWELELHFVVGAQPGKETNLVVIAEEHGIALRNTRLFIGRKVIESNVTPQASHSGFANCSHETQKAANKTLWPQFEIVNEDEREFEAEMSNTDKLDSTQLIFPNSDEGDDDKKSWISFYRRITRAPEQVLRYSRDVGSEPLWPRSSGRPSTTNIPKCSFCGSRRRFEFQKLP